MVFRVICGYSPRIHIYDKLKPSRTDSLVIIVTNAYFKNIFVFHKLMIYFV